MMRKPLLTDEERARWRERLFSPEWPRNFPDIVAVDGVPWAEHVEIMRAEERARRAHFTAVRRARQRQRMPKWADREAIKAVYDRAAQISRETGIPHQVDHDVPLAGDRASGLHVHFNLKIITAAENARKSNKHHE